LLTGIIPPRECDWLCRGGSASAPWQVTGGGLLWSLRQSGCRV